MMNEKVRSGSCYCGKITVKVYGKPISVSICHCTICQRLNGGPFGIQSLHKPTNFEINIIETDDNNNNNNDDDQSQTPTTTTTTTGPSSAAHHPPLGGGGGGGGQQQDDKNDVLLLQQKSKSLWSIQTSKNVTRYRCTDCGSPIYATLGKGKTIVVPRTMLFQKKQQQQQKKKNKNNINQVVDNNDYSDDDEDYRPTHHMHYGSRIIDFNDDLPKYVGSSHPTRGVLYCEKNGHDGKTKKEEQQKKAT